VASHPLQEFTEPVPKDIYVNWSEIGQKAERLRFVSLALVDMILETGDPDVVIASR